MFRAGLVGITVFAALASTAARADQFIECSSIDRRTTWCEVDTRGGVRLERQLSRAGCWEGDTWGYSRRGIWVSNGCRAEFRVFRSRERDDERAAAAIIGLAILGAAIAAGEDERDYRPPRERDWRPPPRRELLVTCESIERRDQYCPVDTRRAEVQLRRQLSSATCQFGYSWGYDRRGIWVRHGCRAEFVVYY